ncbi:HAD-IIB family hydrolase [Sulfurovum sp. zt1-1]|uniref:HAD-IIB family hydrolase n=1 Tax=Sulfurovum zhangzhouensis TaxID=3019067 RepID=A0ABT7QY07_9BACT|nr:HAD-IIB family hydrolase [Sulfurovum zhangzhouensis]MDM5271706.1 HAD-IIB family hydrolase [Sulfurovum zhangzhouensis]
MDKKNKIYITDLDHTFLRTDQSISDFSAKVWNELSKDSILSVATARSFQKTHDFLNKLHLHAPMILLDGTMVVTPEKKLIDLKLINKELGDAVIAEGAKFGIYPFIISLKDMELNESFNVPTTLNLYQKGVLNNYAGDPRLRVHEQIRAEEMNLKIVYFGQLDTLKPLTEHLQKTFSDALEYKLSPEKYSDGWFLTVLHPEGDKAHALKKVAEYLGRDTQEMTVFGDSINDIGMFKLAGTSVAVSNALDEVKEVADIILSHSNDEDAVAKYLHKTTQHK